MSGTFSGGWSRRRLVGPPLVDVPAQAGTVADDLGAVSRLDTLSHGHSHSDRVAFRNYAINLLKLPTEPIGSAVEVQAAARTIAPSARSPLPAWVPTSFRSVESLAALDAELERLGQTSKTRFRAFLADKLDLN